MIAKYLPAKLDACVFCTLTEEQIAAYQHALQEGRREVDPNGAVSQSSAFQLVNFLRKIVNDPEAAMHAQKLSLSSSPAGVDGKAAPSAKRPPPVIQRSLAMSGKLQALSALLLDAKSTTDDRFVLISNFTMTV